jgi:hypothetical protein
LVASMQAHAFDGDIQQRGASALVRLAWADCNRVELDKAGACEAIVATLQAHASDASVQMCGARLVSIMIRQDKVNSVKLGKTGACEVAVAAMRAHPSNSSVQSTVVAWRPCKR